MTRSAPTPWSGGSASGSASSPPRCIGRSPSGRHGWRSKVPDGADHRLALKLLGWVTGLWLIGMMLLFKAAALPAEASGTVIVLFPIGTESAQSIAASAAAGAKLVSPS